MVDGTITVMILVVAAIHLAPISGFLGGRRLVRLYGVDPDDGTVMILLRHRAVLFGILGTFFVYAAFERSLQPLAFVAASTSIASFFYLVASTPGASPAIRKIVIGDVMAAVCLTVAVVLFGE